MQALGASAAAATNRHDFGIAVGQAVRQKHALASGATAAVDVADMDPEEPPEDEPLELRLAGA